MVNTEFIKEEIEDMSDPETSRMNHEDTEEQTGWCLFLILYYWRLRNLKVKLKFTRCSVSEIISNISMINDTENAS